MQELLYLELNGALRELLSEFQKHHGLEVKDEIADLNDLFPNEVQITLSRLFQEHLTIPVRHSKATSVTQKRLFNKIILIFSINHAIVFFNKPCHRICYVRIFFTKFSIQL
jgi:signal transduction histidine kinase